MTVSTRSVAVAPSGSEPDSLKPTTCGTSIESGWPSIAASASIPPTPQPSTPSPFTIVVCESVPTSVSGNATPSRSSTTRARNSRFTWWQMPVPGGTTLKPSNALWPQRRNSVALAVALELELDVARERDARRERVDLHRVVDHELGRDQRVDLRRVAAEVGHRVPHRGEVDDGRHAGQVLEQDARRRERDLVRRLGLRVPARDRVDVGLVAVPEHVLEQHAQRVREPRDVVGGLQLVEAIDLVRPVADGELRRRGHASIQAERRRDPPPAGCDTT